MLTTVLLYLALGALSGLMAGLFGVGGGAVIVPVLIIAFARQGLDPAVLTHIAVGTSLAVICLTSISSVRAHHRNGFVDWPVVRVMAPALVIGVVAGVLTVVRIPGPVLQWIIGSYLCLIAIQMGFDLMPAGHRLQLTRRVQWLAGAVIGWVSALFGIGGGSLTVPFLSFYGVRMQHAVATSAACGFPIAVGGALSNMLAGWGQADLPAGSLGYVYLPAFAGIALMSLPFAKLGANLAKNLPATVLKRIFAGFLVIIGGSLIGRAGGWI